MTSQPLISRPISMVFALVLVSCGQAMDSAELKTAPVGLIL